MHNITMNSELKTTGSSKCEKISDADSSKLLKTDSLSNKLANMEKALREGKPVRLGKCCCKHEKKSKGSSGDLNNSKESGCYKCLKEYLSRNKQSHKEKSDCFGWGLSDLSEQLTSDESSNSTTTSDEEPLERRWSTARHKILRKLRRRKPEAFEHNYINMKMDEILVAEIDDPVTRKAILNVKNSIIFKETQEKYIPKKVESKSDTSLEKVSTSNESLHFDFSHEHYLKDKYSGTKFNLLAGLIHKYQKHLKSNCSEEQYPSVSELMCKASHNISKDDIITRYYEVLHKKGGHKIHSKKDKSNFASSEQLLTACDKSRGKYPLSLGELNRVTKTGILDLSCRSLVDIPVQIWTIDKEFIERMPFFSKRHHSSPSIPKRSKYIYKPLTHLNLSHNNLITFNPKGSCFDTLTHLVLANNFIESLPNNFGDFRNLQSLDLESNLLRRLPDSFCNLISLKELNLRQNLLLALPTPFGNLKKLQSIDLRWNTLISLPETLEDLSLLKMLNVAFNRIKILPIDFSHLYNLVILDISYNKLGKVPELTNMSKLVLVNAMGNLIKEFPNFAKSIMLYEIRLDGNRLKKIKTGNMDDCPVVQLTLSHNKISKIPDDICKIETLVLLDCTNNRLSYLPWSIARLKYLTCIRVEENHIDNLDKETIEAGSKSILKALLSNLLSYDGKDDIVVKAKEDLEELYIKGETSKSECRKNTTVDPTELAKTRYFIKKRLQLTDLPSEWIKLLQRCKVTTVDISMNSFRYIPAGLKELMSTLKELIIRENYIKSIPDFIGRMSKLELLDLSSNCLETLPLCMSSCRLTKFVCRKNEFTMIPKVVYLIQTLQHLDFSDNMIKEIDVDGLRNLKKLTCLNLSKNNITKLPSNLGYMSNIKQLDVGENDFRSPGLYILRGGTQAILAYLKRHPN